MAKARLLVSHQNRSLPSLCASGFHPPANTCSAGAELRQRKAGMARSTSPQATGFHSTSLENIPDGTCLPGRQVKRLSS